MIELTAFHFECLKKFAGVRALTETGLARAMHQDKAIVKHAIKTLIGKGVLKQIGPYEFALSHEGSMHLKAKGAALTEPAKASKEKELTPKADSLAKLQALDLPPSDQSLQALADMTGEDVVPDFYKAITEGDDQLAFNVRKSGVLNIENGQAKFTPAPEQEPDPQVPTLPGVDQIVFVESTPEGSDKLRSVWNEGTGPGTKPAGEIVYPAPSGDWPQVQAIVELPTPERADFGTLVRQGLARLNAQLGLQPIAIENAALKVETLEAIAESIGATNEPHVYTLLRAIAQDIQRIADRSS